MAFRKGYNVVLQRVAISLVSCLENKAMCFRLIVWSMVGLCWGQFLRADTIVLKSGEHIQGQIVGESPEDVSVRRSNKSGSIKYVEKIKRTEIARVERGTEQPADSGAGAAEAAATQPAEVPLPSQKIADKPAFLETAIKKYQKPDYYAAGIDLARLINTSTSSELQSLSKQVEKTLEMSLAELAAQTHFKAAIERSRGRAVKFDYITEYEKQFLIPLIDEEYKKTIAEDIAVAEENEGKEAGEHTRGQNVGRRTGGEREAGVPAEGRDAENGERGNRRNVNARAAAARRVVNRRTGPVREGPEKEDGREEGGKEHAKTATSRPAMTILAWLDRPESFNGTKQESEAMAIKIYHASSLVTERMRLDPEVKKDAALRTELSKERGRLAALLSAVKARSRGALTAEEKKAREAQMRNQMDAARREQMRRNRDPLGDLQRVIEEQQRPAPPPANNNPRNGE